MCVQVHLSDSHGSEILRDLMWTAAYEFFERSASKPLVPRETARPYKPRFVPRVVVKGLESISPPDPPEWTKVRSGRKVRYLACTFIGRKEFIE